MASLNLDALKKKAPESSENIIQDTATATITETPISSWMPKISLMKLKEFSSHEQVESIPTPTQAPEEVTNIVEEVESIPQEIPTSEVSTSLIVDDSDATEVNSGESIFSMEVQEEAKEEATTQEPEIKVEEAKEFFPSLNLMEDFNISDDLLGIEDMSIKTEELVVTPAAIEEEVMVETPSMIIEESPIVTETSLTEEVTQEVSVVTEKQEMIETKDVKEEISSLSMPVAHVQEVKNELSEQRKWGFRFFAKKKASVLAWIGIITTFSLIGLFSAGFFSTAVPSGKSNIQEAMQPIVSEEVTQSTPEVIETMPEVAPTTTVPTQEVVESAPETIETTPVVTQPNPEVIEVAPVATQPTPEMTEPVPTPTVYEAGRDYTVIKNTKKNLKKQ